MTELEFTEQISRLNDAFKGYYTKPRVKEISRIVHQHPGDQFAAWVGSRIWDKEPPKIDAFYSFASRFHSDKPKQQFPDCGYCSNFGTVMATKKEEGGSEYEFAFACTFCPRGEKEPTIVPRWGNNWANAGYKLHLIDELKPDAQIIEFKDHFKKLVESKDINKIVNDDEDVF